MTAPTIGYRRAASEGASNDQGSWALLCWSFILVSAVLGAGLHLVLSLVLGAVIGLIPFGC